MKTGYAVDAFLVVTLIVLFCVAIADFKDVPVKLKAFPVFDRSWVKCKFRKKPKGRGFSVSCSQDQVGIIYLDPGVFDRMDESDVRIYRRPRIQSKPEGER